MGLQEVEIWLDVGRGGRLFSYVDGKNLGVELGDIVLVKLRERLMHGFVANKKSCSNTHSYGRRDLDERIISLKNVEDIVEKAAFDSHWRKWLARSAELCHTSLFQMLKTALPSGWLNYSKFKNLESKKCWWVELTNQAFLLEKLTGKHNELKEQLLKDGGGAWQKDLLSKGFSLELLKRGLKNELIRREKRPIENRKPNIFAGKTSYLNSLVLAKKLTDEQQFALDLYEQEPGGSPFLLWGVTGSGKTEVYLHMISRELIKSRHCLLLVPRVHHGFFQRCGAWFIFLQRDHSSSILPRSGIYRNHSVA